MPNRGGDNEDARFVFSAILNYDSYRVEAVDGGDGVACALKHRRT